MYYELYIDIFFVINFVIDFISLSILKRLLHLNGRVLRRVIASFFASSVICIYFIFDLRALKFNMIIMLILTSPVIVLMSYKFKSFFAFVKSLVIFFVINMCLNGFLNIFITKINLGYQLLIAIICAYLAFLLVKFLIDSYAGVQNDVHEVTFILGENQIVARGIIDTGNCLISPYHNRGVSIVEYEVFEKYLSEYAKKNIMAFFGENDMNSSMSCANEVYEKLNGNLEKIFAVPYRTISTPSGILPVMAVDKMYINENGEVKEYKKALVGFIKGKVSTAGDINVILSTKIE